MFQKIPENVPEDSGECSRGFRGMFKKIPGNVQEDSGECSKRFRGILEDFGESKFIFYQIQQLKCEKTKEYFLRY